MSSPQTDTAGPASLLEINLDHISRNYLSLQKRLARGADCAAVVKADAYGLGAVRVAQALYEANCRHFFTAFAEEAAEVRKALGERTHEEAHIYILQGLYGMAMEDIAAQNLIPVLNTPEDIHLWAAFAEKSGAKKKAVIQIDTGMNRLGLSAAEVQRLKNHAGVQEALDVRFVMSHLACAEVPEAPENQTQLEKFRKLAAELGWPCRLSLANSSGIFLGSAYHFDLARPGAAIYGIAPQENTPNPMLGVVTLKARILQIREAAAGETVGYGASYRVSKPAKLATISSGYADGYLRSFAKNGIVYIRGQKCPVVGRISMDALVADITALYPQPAAGEWAEIIGQHQGVDEVARQAGTIGYEILTSLGKRYKKVYTAEE